MANIEVTGNDISIHARGSWRDDFLIADEAGNFLDISNLKLFFEVDGVSLREALVADPENPTVQWLSLERAQIEKLTRSPQRYSIIDETDIDEDLPVVLAEGTIRYHGYKGLPDAVAE
jgi:hypothetical protein